MKSLSIESRTARQFNIAETICTVIAAIRSNAEKIRIAFGVVFFCLGMLCATGIDYNPVQAVYTLLLVFAAYACLKDSKEEEDKK